MLDLYWDFTVCPMLLVLQRLQLSVFDEGNNGFLTLPQLHRFLEAVVPTAPMLQSMEVRSDVARAQPITAAVHSC